MSKTAALKLSDNPSKINDQRPQLEACSHRDEPKTSMCMSNMAGMKVAGKAMIHVLVLTSSATMTNNVLWCKTLKHPYPNE